MSTPRYQAYYCEENAWHLCADPQLADARVEVAIVSNAERSVALWQQRAATRADAPVVWDYHVLLFAMTTSEWRAWDLDTTLAFPIDAARYLAGTFRPVPPQLSPRFRVLAADEYRRVLASDRRHMRDDAGGWLQPPPPWPPIGDGHTLPELLDLERASPGEWLTLAELQRRYR